LASPPPALGPVRALFVYDLETHAVATLSSGAPTGCDVSGEEVQVAECVVSGSLSWKGPGGSEITIPIEQLHYQHTIASKPWTEYRYEGSWVVQIPGVAELEVTTPVIFTVIYYDADPGHLWGTLELKEFGATHWHRAARLPSR
jgi:hypothetical protein